MKAMLLNGVEDLNRNHFSLELAHIQIPIPIRLRRAMR